MPTPADYLAFKASQQQANVGKANIVLGRDFQQEPDQVAGDLNFAKEATAAVGNPVPLSMVQDPDTRSVFARIIDEKKRSTVLTQSPKLSDWLRTPGNADLTRDDLEGLSWWETATGAGSNAVQRGAMRLPQMYNQWMAEGAAQRYQDRNSSFADIYGQERATVGVEGKLIDTAVGPITDVWTAGSRFLTARLSDAFGGDQQQAAAYYQQQVGEIGNKIASISMSPAASAVRDQIGALKPTGDVMGDVGNFLRVIGSDPAGFTAFLAETAAETAPSLAAAFGVGVVTRNPGAVATTLGVSSGLQERFTGPADFLQKKGIDISTPEGAMAAISDPALMAEAARTGTIRGVIIGALDGISGGMAEEVLSKNPLFNLLLQSVVQATFGGGGEAAGQIASGQQFSVSDVLIEAMAEFVTAPLDVASMAATKFHEGRGKATDAAATVETLTGLSEQAAASVTRTRSPDTFRNFLEAANAGGARENLYVPAASFVEYFQSRGIDPFEVADTLSGMSREDVQTAIDTGGSVQIPTATWAADMAGGEHDQFVIQNAAFSPDAMTGTEAAAFEADKNNLLSEAWAQAEAARQDADANRQIREQEFDTALGQLRAAGQSLDVARVNAEIFAAGRATLAEREGLTPEEFAARYPLPTIQGQRPAGLDPKNVDELTRTLAEARNRKAVGLDTGKTPLMEFISQRGGIVDPGGELKNLGAAVVKRPGKKTLRVERQGVVAGMRDMLGGSADRGLDTTARAAVESGFMADDPDVLAWKEAERAGTEAPDLSAALLRAIEAEAAGPVDAAPDALGGIEEYLAGLGVGLGDSDAAIRAAIEGDAGRAYGQGPAQGEFLFSNPPTRTDTDAFRSWFEGSVVMDANGDPLVVHHTTWTDFDAFDRQYAAKKFGRDMEGIDTIGLWFSDNQAANYGPKRMDVYLNIKKPLYFDDIPGGDDAFTQLYNLIKEEGGATAYREILKAGGFDGIIFSGTKLDGWEQNVMIPFEPEQIKSVTNVGRFDPADPSIYNQSDLGFNGAGGGARGSIQFPGAGVSNGQTIISLFQSADLSTFLHESGHYFLTVTQDMARLDPNGQAAAEYQTIKDWWYQNADAVAKDAGPTVTADDVRAALDNGTTGDAVKDRLIDTGMQEQFARANEQYLMEGKAPSVALRGAFEKFQAWLVSIYKSMRGLNVNVTDELRGVFDRLLATDAEIEQARAEAGTDINLTAADLGMTSEQFASFLRLRDQAKDDAKAKTLNEAMMPIRRAATKAYQAERAKVHDRIETETKQQPVYRAIQELRFGKAFDGSEVTPLKLNRALIERDYGAGYIPYLPGATKDGRGHKNAVFAVEGGVHPDIAAGAYGFKSGKDMLDALANAPDMNQLIDAETAKEMEFRHNDPLKDGSIQQTAMDAVHSDLQGQVLAARLEAFNAIAGTDRGLTHKQAREAARRSLRTMAVKDATRADRFLAAERKAAAEVQKLTAAVTRTTMWADAARRRVEKQARGAVREGDAKATLSLPVDKANETAMRQNKDAAALVEAQRRQLLNHMLYSEARKVAADTDSTIKRLSILGKANARLSKTRDINFVMAARAVAGKFGLTKPDADFDFQSWLDQLRFDDPVTAAAMVDTIDTYSQEARHFKDLTVTEFGAVKDAIDSLMAMAKTTRALEIDGQRIDRRDAIDALIAVAEPRGKVRVGTTAAPTKGEKSFIASLTTGAALVRTEAWARDMDDGKAGVFTRYLVKPVMDALADYRAAKTERMDQLLAIVEPRRGDLLGARVAAPEIGYTFENKGALLHALLHTGNESNKKKLLLGWGWSKGMINQKPATTKAGKPRVDRQGQPIMDKGTLDTTAWDTMIERMIADGTITAADKKMVEDIWTLMDAMKRPAQAAHKKIYGHYFAEIEAAPFTNALGTWRGGYVPAIIDQYASIDAGKQDAAAALDSQMDASMFPTTGSGFTKGRVEYNQPLALNLQSLPGHMDKVLRFTHLEPTIRQTSSLISDRGLREAIGNVNRDAIDAILTPWLVRTARQAVETPETGPSAREAGKVWRTIRKRTGLHMMALNIVNAAQQVTGIPTAAVLVKVKHLTAATVRFAKDGGTMRTEAVTASAMMRDRMDNSSRMTADEIDKIIVEPTTQAEVGRFVNQHGYVLQQVTQNLVDLVVWHGAYDQATQQGMTADDAVFEADSVVRRTQGSFNPEDVSTFETGTASQRVLTMFYSYFNTMLNLVGGEAMTEIRTVGWKSPRLFSIYFFGVLAPAVLAEAVSQAARGELGDEDDDGLTDDMLELFLGSQVKFLAGMVPFVGPLTVAAINNFNKLQYDDKLSLSPAVYVGERVVRAPATVIDAMRGEGSPSRAVADGITALGLITGIPTGQLAKSAGYLVGIGEGKSEPQNALDVVRGVTSGRDGTE